MQRVNVDFTLDMLKDLDNMAKKRFCSIRSIKSTANSGINSTRLFLTEPLSSKAF